MSLFGLSLAYLRDRAAHTLLNIVLLALTVATMVVLILFQAQLQQRFSRDAQGIDLVVGAKGSPLQLILSSIYQVDLPTGNIPLSTLETLSADPLVARAIPLALGDRFRSFRIVGTTGAYVELYGAAPAAGRLWQAPFEVTIGAEVARVTGAAPGQRFVGSHGLAADRDGEGHAEHPFTVVGVLQPTGTVLDRLILTSLDTVWDVHGMGHEAAEVTSILVTYKTARGALLLPRKIDSQPGLQAAVPALEIVRLLSLLGVGFDGIRVLAGLLLLTAGLSVFVAIYTSLRQRQADMAILRILGAGRPAIFAQIVTEGVLAAAAGAFCGVLLGHLAVAVAASRFAPLREMGLSGLQVQPAELAVVALALGIGALAATLSAMRVFGRDIADTMAAAG